MTAHTDILPTNNPYNLYNFEANARFSQLSTREFSQSHIALLKGAAPSENGQERLALKGVAVKGGEYSC